MALSLRMKPGGNDFSTLSVPGMLCWLVTHCHSGQLIFCSFFFHFLKENCPNLRELNLTGTNIRTFHIEKLQVGSQLCRVKCNNSTHFCICANSKLWVLFTITINLMIDLPTCSVVILLVFCRLAVPSYKNCSCLHCSFFLHRKLMKRYFVNKNTRKKD